MYSHSQQVCQARTQSGSSETSHVPETCPSRKRHHSLPRGHCDFTVGKGNSFLATARVFVAPLPNGWTLSVSADCPILCRCVSSEADPKRTCCESKLT